MPDTTTRPAHHSVPDYDLTNGDLAAQVGEDLGMPPDPDQRAILDAIYAYRRETPDQPVCFDVGVIAPRQNIKTSTLEIAALTDLFVFQEPLHIWTAHLFKTAQQTFKHMVTLVESNPDYRRKCRKPRTANGDEAIVLLTGEEIQFHARSKGGGRGLTARKVTLDEALFLSSLDMGALAPTTATIADAQLRYGSSAGMVTSDVLRAIRDRGRSGLDPSLAYFEWGAERRPCSEQRCQHGVGTEGCALDDRELWRQANVALGRRITEETLANLRRSMPPKEFAREFLGWWDDPPDSEGGAFDIGVWLGHATPDAERGSGVVFGVDVGEDRMAHVAVAWRCTCSSKQPCSKIDGAIHVMLAASGLSPIHTPGALRELEAKWKGPVILGGPSALLEDEVRSSLVMSGTDFAAACGRFGDLFTDGKVKHGNQRSLNEAVAAARWRSVGSAGERALQLKNAPAVGPLAAVVRAVHGLISMAKSPPPTPMIEPPTSSKSDEQNVMTMNF